jgi:hypothetical protein
LIQTQNDVIQGAGKVCKNDNTWGKLTELVCHQTKKVNNSRVTNVCKEIGPLLGFVYFLVS